jgi:hypothetical protein
MNLRELLPAVPTLAALIALSGTSRGQCSQALSLPDSQPAAGFFVGSNFGAHVAISDDWAVVGEPSFSSGGGLIGNGRIVVYHRTSGATWTEDHIVTGPSSFANLGSSVSLDATYYAPDFLPIVAGMVGANSVLFHTLIHGSWTNQTFTHNTGSFGFAVATDADFAAASDPNASQGYVEFYRSDVNTGVWTAQSTVSWSSSSVPAEFGASLAMDFSWAHGWTIAIGAPSHATPGSPVGAVAQMSWTGGGWSLNQLIIQPMFAPDIDFGRAVALRDPHLVVGAPAAQNSLGQVYPFHYDGSSWASTGTAYYYPDPNSQSGASVAIDGDRWTFAAPGRAGGHGIVALESFTTGLGIGVLLSPNQASGDSFGSAMDYSNGFVLVGDPTHSFGRGAAYLFRPLLVDCNGNGIDDMCDITSGAAHDCNANGIPDSCDIASGFAQDCNGNGIPDSCEGVSPMSILQNPTSNLNAMLGGQQTFSVSVSGGPPSYAWRKNGIVLTNGGSISGATTAILTINPVTAASAGNYDVVVTGPCNQLTSTVAVLDFNPGTPFCFGDNGWSGNAWSTLAGGTSSGEIHALVAFDDGQGQGTRLFAGGTFTSIGGVSASHIAVWNGTNWSAIVGLDGSVDALVVADLDGPGGNPPALYAGGSFLSQDGGVPLLHGIARWNGSGWSPLGSGQVGVSGSVAAMCVHDFDGSGPQLPGLYVAGAFNSAGNSSAKYVARWDGSTWSAVGNQGNLHESSSICSFDDGSGPALYLGVVGGNAGLYQLNSSSQHWNQVLAPPNRIAALQVFDRDGAGPLQPDIYIGLSDPSGGSGGLIAYLAGPTFNSGIVGGVRTLCVGASSTGQAQQLFIGGAFTSIVTATATLAAQGLASYDGNHVNPATLGLTPTLPAAGQALVAVSGIGGSTPLRLYVGGSFNAAGGLAAGNIAAVDLDRVVCPCGNIGAAGHGCANSINSAGALLTSSGIASLSADTLRLTASGELASAFSIPSQGSLVINLIVFGDGLRCVGGSLKRLYKHNAVNGVLTVPQPGDPSISARSATLGDVITTGSTRYYYTYYRDPSQSFCAAPAGNTWNVTNSIAVQWSP